MRPKRYLKEVDLVANGFSENSKKFLEESRCIMYFLSECVDKTVESNYKKIVLKIWPLGKMAELGIKPFMKDDASKVLVIEVEYDLQNYYAIEDINLRRLEVFRLLKKAIATIPSEIKIDNENLLKTVRYMEGNDSIYTKEIGRWVYNSSKAISVKMLIEFNAEKILFCIKVRGNTLAKEFCQVFARFKPFEAARLYEFCKIEFCDDERVVCKFRQHYKPIEFKLKMDNRS